MEIKEEIKKNSNGSVTNIKTIETTPEDGFVPESVLRPASRSTYGKYHKGYAKTVSVSTNNPKVTRPVVYGMCGIVLVIGILAFLTFSKFLGLIFIGFSILFFFNAKKEIDEVAKKIKNQTQDFTNTNDENKIENNSSNTISRE